MASANNSLAKATCSLMFNLLENLVVLCIIPEHISPATKKYVFFIPSLTICPQTLSNN